MINKLNFVTVIFLLVNKKVDICASTEHITLQGEVQFTGGCSVHREDIKSTLGGYHEYTGMFSTLEGYHEYTVGIPS